MLLKFISSALGVLVTISIVLNIIRIKNLTDYISELVEILQKDLSDIKSQIYLTNSYISENKSTSTAEEIFQEFQSNKQEK